jgi:hypothetical protein
MLRLAVPKWRDSFYAEVPQPDWFEHYLKRFDTVEINASFLLMADGGPSPGLVAQAGSKNRQGL